MHSAHTVSETVYAVENGYAPAVVLLDDLFKRAIEREASDIHLESTLQGVQIRFRIDGLLCLGEC